MAAIHELGARELGAAYARGELSPVETARSALARIAAWEPKINAMYRVLREAALEQRALAGETVLADLFGNQPKRQGRAD